MDRFLENKMSFWIYPDTQILLGRKNGKPNLSLEATGDAAQVPISMIIRDGGRTLKYENIILNS